MPNLVPPVTTVEVARAYRERILAAAPEGFTPFLTCYLTDDVDGDALVSGWREGAWIAAKLYPANATTNSSHGVTNVQAVEGALRAMAAAGMTLCVHGEVTTPEIDVFDREKVFLDTVLGPLLERIPDLRVVVEHATTAASIEFVRSRTENVAASITPHHLWWNRNALFDGGLRPHAYCLPILKREADRLALLEAATSGDPRFFAGTDSAPHSRDRKECDHGCAGVFNAPTALVAYAEIFDAAGALDRLEGFVSEHGARFYGVPLNEGTIRLERSTSTPNAELSVEGQEPVTVFLGGTERAWRVA